MSRASRGLRITGRIIKALAMAVVFSVIALLVWRIFSSGTPKSMKALTPNERLAAAYEVYGDELYIFNQDQKSITTAERNYGYFSITECYIIPEAEQIQLVFRYNNSTIRSLAEDYSLTEIPSPDDHLYDVSICIQTDLTPDNKEDNAGDVDGSVGYERIFPNAELTKHERKNLYNYYRYVFDFGEAGLSLSDMLESGSLLAVYADVYYVNDINYEEQAYGTLCLYDYLTERVDVKLKARDRSAIKAFAEQ